MTPPGPPCRVDQQVMKQLAPAALSAIKSRSLDQWFGEQADIEAKIIAFLTALDPRCSTTADTDYAIDALLAAGFSPDQQVLELPAGMQYMCAYVRMQILQMNKHLQPTRGCRSLQISSWTSVPEPMFPLCCNLDPSHKDPPRQFLKPYSECHAAKLAS